MGFALGELVGPWAAQSAIAGRLSFGRLRMNGRVTACALELPGAQQHQRAGLLMRDAGGVETRLEFGAFGTGVEDHASRAEPHDVLGDRGGSLGADVQGEGVDGTLDVAQPVDDRQAFRYIKPGVDGNDLVAMLQQQPDRLVGVSFGFVAGAHDDDALCVLAHAGRLRRGVEDIKAECARNRRRDPRALDRQRPIGKDCTLKTIEDAWCKSKRGWSASSGNQRGPN